MAQEMQEENKQDDIFDLSVEQITQKLEDIHESLFDANTFNLNYNISTYSPSSNSAAGYSFNSPSKSTAVSSQSTKSAGNNSYTSPEGKKNPMYDIDNMSVLSHNSFMSSGSGLSQNSNYTTYPTQQQLQKVLNFRDPTPSTPSPAKYTKSSIPFGNPFKITIRPSNNFELNDSDLVNEDDAFNTKVLEKKKASRLASFAAVYKSKVKKQISSYIKYHKESKADNMKKIDNYLQILVKKHAEERQRKIRRQNEIKTGQMNVKMDEDLGRKRGFNEINNFDFDDFGVDFNDFEEQEEDLGDLVPQATPQNDFQVKNILKTDIFNFALDGYGFDASENLFDDLFKLKEALQAKMDSSIGSEWKRALRQKLRYIRIRYRECYDSEQLNQLVTKFVKDHFEMDL